MPGRLAGIDYGTVRIGIAVTDPDRRLASPLENYTRRGQAADEAFFKRLAEEERIVVATWQRDRDPILRASFQGYNDGSDLEALLEALPRSLKEAGSGRGAAVRP